MSLGVGFTSSTIISIICLGVLNCPFFPAVVNLLSMYSYRSPKSFKGKSAISSSILVTTVSSILGVGIVKIASSINLANDESALPFNFFIKGKTSVATTLYIFSESKCLKLDHLNSSLSLSNITLGFIPKILASFSEFNCLSSNDFINSK